MKNNELKEQLITSSFFIIEKGFEKIDKLYQESQKQLAIDFSEIIKRNLKIK